MAYDDAVTPTVPGGDNPEGEDGKAEIINDWARIEWESGNSYYVLTGPDGVEERFIRVTSPLEPVAKNALVPWAGKLAAEAAYEQLPRVVASQLLQPCGRTYRRCEHDFRTNCVECPCRDCPTCMAKYLQDRHLAVTYRRSDEGTRMHRWIKWWILEDTGGDTPVVDQDLEPYVAMFLRFVADFHLTPRSFEWAESIVINREHGYAGTCDAGIWIVRDPQYPKTVELLDRLTQDGQPRVTKALVMADWKSREKEGRQPFIDMSLQLVGYRKAQVMRLYDGSEIPMPKVDATVVVQIRPDDYDVIPTLSDDEEFQGFLGFLQGHRWVITRGAMSVAARTFKFAPSVARARATDGARARKAAKAAATALPESTVDRPGTPSGKSKVDTKPPRKSTPASKLTRTESVLGRPPVDLVEQSEPPF